MLYCFLTNPKNLPAIFLYHILITANMQSKTGFPSSHQLKSYVAPKYRLKFAARCPVRSCWPSCLRLCLLYIVKNIDSIRTKLTEVIHSEVCPYRHNATMDATPPSNAMRQPQAPTRCGVPVAQRTTPFTAGKV